jgi:hypothetical protein
MNEIKIKLGSGRSDNTQAFMDELDTLTSEHPFNPAMRILGNATVEARPFNKQIHISDIVSLAPKSGAATQAMKVLTGLADKHRVKLDLTAKAYHNDKRYVTDTAVLVKWYRKLGFVVDDEFMDDDAIEHDDFEGYDEIDMIYHPR